jgi:type II secretory pathway pseudopilin PulG
MKPFRMDSRRGSALLASMIVVTVLSFAAAGILSYSLNTYENSMRQALLDQAREVADSEMEYLYYGWKNVLMSRTVAIANIDSSSAMAAYLTTGSEPYLKALQYPVGQPQWTVTRAIQFKPVGLSTGDGSAEGVVNGNLIGKNYYFDAWTSAAFSSAVLGTVQFKTGRHFAYSSTPLFQYAVFYEGNLELAPGGNMTVNGPISTNGSAYLGSATTGYKLTLTDQVAYFQDYNGASDPLSGETDLLEGTSTLADPVYNPNPLSPDPIQTTQRAIQVTHLTAQASFIGGVDVQADVNNAAYAQAYTNPQGVVDPNEIYRAVIAPPPLVPGTTNLATEDPVVAASRMYNNAGILITISEDPLLGKQVHVGNAASPTYYDALLPSISNPGTNAPGDTSSLEGVRTAILDPREYANGNTSVNITTLNVGNLLNELDSARTGVLAGLHPTESATLKNTYNGMVYVYDSTDNNDAALDAVHPSYANSLNGIRLINGAQTPNYSDTDGNPIGFTVVRTMGCISRATTTRT